MARRNQIDQWLSRQRLSGFAALLCLALAGCGGSHGDGDRLASRVTRLQLDIQSQPLELRHGRDGQPRQISADDPSYVERIQVTVEAADIPIPVQATFELAANQQQTFSSRLEVPLGRDRALSVNAYNHDGISIFHGAMQVNLIEEETFCQPIDTPTTAPNEAAAEIICQVTIPLERDQFIPIDAAATDLATHSFSFESGNPFGLTRSPATLHIGATVQSRGDSTPFLLTSTDGAASGDLVQTQDACQLTVHLSTFPDPLGPQAGNVMQIEPCQIDAIDGRLITAVDGTSEQAVSQPPAALDNQAPIIVNPGPQIGHESDAVDLTIGASDINGDALTFQLTGLPPGLQFDPATGRISGALAPTASSASPYPVAVSVSDGNTEVSTSFTWTVNQPVWGQLRWGVAHWNQP